VSGYEVVISKLWNDPGNVLIWIEASNVDVTLADEYRVLNH